MARQVHNEHSEVPMTKPLPTFAVSRRVLFLVAGLAAAAAAMV